jgi:hypothetical protein
VGSSSGSLSATAAVGWRYGDGQGALFVKLTNALAWAAASSGSDLLTGIRHEGHVALPAGSVAVIREE